MAPRPASVRVVLIARTIRLVLITCLALAGVPRPGLTMSRAAPPGGGQVNIEVIVFEGRLMEMPSEAPRCGDTKVAVAHRFQVQRVVKGTAGETEAIVLVPCPDLMGDQFFRAKSEYVIEATNDLAAAASYTVYNDYKNRPLRWGVRITKRQ